MFCFNHYLTSLFLILVTSFIIEANTINPKDASDIWSLVLLTEEKTTYGAMCIDGTPAALYYKLGSGENSSKFILFFEGGGWDVSIPDAYGRSLTPLGSSKTYPNSTNEYLVRDVLDTNCTNNPYFCTWTSVYMPYCDGQSRAGNLEASINHLLENYNLNQADHVLISGSSAGGLTTILHSDYITNTLRKVNPNVIVKAVPEVGFFLDANSIWNNEHLYTQVYSRVALFANITTGLPAQVNEGCVANTPANERWKCFMAQYTYPYITTPVFLLNSMVDEWQASNILAPNYNTDPYVTTYGPFIPCIEDPAKGCNSTQFQQWFGYGDQFMLALNTSIKATPVSSMNQNGGFITSCPIHTTAISGLSHKIHINGVSMYEALASWYFEKQGPGGQQYWTIDKVWPNNPTCPKPGPVTELRMM